FSLPKSKLLGYVLPAVPPLAVLLADGFESSRLHSQWATRGWWASAATTMVLSIVAIVALAIQPPRSTKEIGATLRAQRFANEPVYMLDNYYFDLPLYARLTAPVTVVLDWTDPELRRRDTWRKELADAAAFAPQDERAVLLTPDRLAFALCAAPVSWVVGPTSAARDLPFLVEGSTVTAVRGETLWRVERARLKALASGPCAGIPNAG
ncbi:MAG: glycosyltransferase family 39 protein, partial [Caldimonas sp.]